MALLLPDRVKESATTTGTGTFSLAGAATGYVGFVSAVGNANTCFYCIQHQTANEWEVGIGTVTDAATDTLSRDTVLAGTNGTSKVNFSAGTKDVFVTAPAAVLANFLSGGTAIALIKPGTDGTAAILFCKADGSTKVGQLDTTNLRTFWGDIASAALSGAKGHHFISDDDQIVSAWETRYDGMARFIFANLYNPGSTARTVAWDLYARDAAGTQTAPARLLAGWIDAAAATRTAFFDVYTEINASLGQRCRFAGSSFIVGGTAVGASGEAVLAIKNSTEPGALTDTVQLVALDTATTQKNLFVVNEEAKREQLSGLRGFNSTEFSKTSNTTFGTITGLTRNVEAGKWYGFKSVVQYTCGNGNIKVQINGTATATLCRHVYNATGSYSATVTTLNSGGFTVVGTTEGIFVIEGMIQVNAAGTLTVEMAQASSNGTATVAKAGSYLELIPLGA